MKRADLSGVRCGSLVAKAIDGRRNGNIYWRCLCDCGASTAIRADHLTGGRVKSCGCGRMSADGQSETALYAIWRAIIRRCRDSNDRAYQWYGARGIKVCDRWLDFAVFRADVGEPPAGMWLDRRDNEQGYTPENCRWATPKQQANNTRGNRVLEIDGERLTLTEAAERYSLEPNTLKARLDRGWSVADAISHPLRGTPAWWGIPRKQRIRRAA